MVQSHKAVVLFYKYFVPSECPEVFNRHAAFYADRILEFQRTLCRRLGCKGRILVSVEGINGTISGQDREITGEYVSVMRSFHLLKDCGLPEDEEGDSALYDDDRCLFFHDVDWKESVADEVSNEPFPDLKVTIVKEIVSTGGLVGVEDIPKSTGKHLSPSEFHMAITNSEKPVVLVDVRNTFEHDIGHFVLPGTGEAAMNPEMVTFSSFEKNFCAKHADDLRDKKVLMYCTGGIRCEKASVMLKKRGVQDVNQLRGGIHRYLEEFGNDGHYKGLNFVFDQRVAMKPDPYQPQNEVVGRCVYCHAAYDEICGSRVCTVCRDLVLACTSCQSKLREYHCRRHFQWKDSYFTFLEGFGADELKQQRIKLEKLRGELAGSKCQRRTIGRQMEKISSHLRKLERGETSVCKNAPRRCRSCMEPSTICDGRCWGFWKTKSGRTSKEAIHPVQVGDIVEPADDWNTLKLGDKTTLSGHLKRGKVIELKEWSGSADDKDCVSVLWDDPTGQRTRNQAKLQPQIYRWGVPTLDGIRRYDVRKVDFHDA